MVFQRGFNFGKLNKKIIFNYDNAFLKEILLQLDKIQQNGSTDVEALIDPKILKRPDQIKEFLEYCKRNNKTEEVLKINATHANDTKLVRK